jgi:hypothetical protein
MLAVQPKSTDEMPSVTLQMLVIVSRCWRYSLKIPTQVLGQIRIACDLLEMLAV